MKFAVSAKSETPLYLQLYNQIVSQIVCGDLAPHNCLPSIRLVARELEISVIPVKAAYDMLENEGYIYTLPGKGCFVSALRRTERQMLLASQKVQECVNFCLQLGLSDKQISEMLQQCLQS